MGTNPTYEELEQRIRDLEQELQHLRGTADAARHNEQYLTAILDNTNLPIYLKDADYHYILINQEFAKLARITCDQIRGKDDFAVFPEPVARLFREQDEEVKCRDTLVEFKETIPLADGVHVFLTAKFPLHDAAGKIYAIGGVCTDITPLEKTRDTLQKSEERYRSFISNFPGIAFRGILDTYTPEFIHGEVEAITGYREEELVAGKPSWDKLVHPDDLPEFIREEENIRQIPNHSFRREYRIVRKDGDIRWVLDRGQNICDASGKPVFVEGTVNDITPRKNMELALRESEEKYRKLFTNDIDAIVIFDVETLRILDVNDAFLKLYGYSREEVLQLKADDMSAEPEQTRSAINISAQEGEAFIPIRRHKKKDGTEIIVQLSAGPYTWKGRMVMYSIIRDISEQVRTENALRESEEKYRTLVETASLGIQISDREGRIILSNPAHHRIQEVPDGELVGRYVWDFIEDPAEKNNLREYYGSVIEKQPRPKAYLTVNKTASGREIQVQVDWNYLRDSTGQVVGLCSIITDITARVRAEKARRESEERLTSIIDSCPEGIHLYTLEPDGRLIFTGANPAASSILHVDCDQFVGKTIEEAFPGLIDTEIPTQYRGVCRTGKPWQAEQIFYEDQQIRGAFTVNAFRTGPERMAVFFQDITLKQRMEQELQKIQKLESVGILAGGIAHDFNNLLTAILGNISMAKLFAQTDQAKVLERLADAEYASLRARDLTQQLLTFAKGGAPVKSAADLREIIRDSTSFMLSGSNVRCHLQLPDDLWAVEIDVGQISQVIQNLVKNADQAMPEGGIITIAAANQTLAEDCGLPLRPGNYVHFSIADQGTGIPKKYLARIFDPYFSTKQEGSGLGLAASHSIIKNHDGLIYAESEHGSGATFHIFLPASDRKPTPATLPRKRSQRSGEHILIMDDDENVLQVAENMLSLMGYRTTVTRDGAEAIAVYKKALDSGQPFDGVLLDLTIPGGMGGRETIKQLASLDPEVKAIVSSGYANDPIMADYAAYGFKGVACKPYDMEHLGHVFRDLFD